MRVEIDETSGEYKGVYANLKTTRRVGLPEQRFTYVLHIGNVSLEIEEKDAVQISEDLLNCVSDSHDPNSEMRRRWAARFHDNGDGTFTING